MLCLDTNGLTKFILIDRRSGETIGEVMFNGVSNVNNFTTVFDMPNHIFVRRTRNIAKESGHDESGY